MSCRISKTGKYGFVELNNTTDIKLNNIYKMAERIIQLCERPVQRIKSAGH